MNGQNEENLKELFEKFVTAEEAERAVENIHKGEQILRENPAPQPSDELIAEIKSEIAKGLLQRPTAVFGFRKMAYKVAAVAAAVIILTGIGIKIFEKGAEPYEPEEFEYASIIPTSIWDSDNIATDDMDLAILNAEIEQIESEVLALKLVESEGNGQTALSELEMELEELESDFWKG